MHINFRIRSKRPKFVNIIWFYRFGLGIWFHRVVLNIGHLMVTTKSSFILGLERIHNGNDSCRHDNSETLLYEGLGSIQYCMDCEKPITFVKH